MSLLSPTGLQSASKHSRRAWPSPMSSSSTSWQGPPQSSSNSDALAPMNIELSHLTLDRPPVAPSSFFHPSQQQPPKSPYQHLFVLPVLFLEFLALALTRAVLPHLLLEHYQSQVYVVMGLVEFVRGLLAFVSCPLFGKLSDVVGRRLCLLVTVAGTCAPVCSLALLSWQVVAVSNNNNDTLLVDAAAAVLDNTNEASPPLEESSFASSWQQQQQQQQQQGDSVTSQTTDYMYALHPTSITIFVVLLALSGVFSSTFTLVFAYISDTVRERDERVSAYGLALATFGLSFTMGPMLGGYLAQYNTRHVFVACLILTLLDLLYIYAVLPESIQPSQQRQYGIASSASSTSSNASVTRILDGLEQANVSWSTPWDTLRIVSLDPFLRCVGQVAFLYYTALWAMISTLTLYATKRFQLGPERLGELMSLLGLSTMVSEAVLVRMVVPLLGEKRAMRVGLLAFAMQCVVLGFAYEGWHLFVCIAFSLGGNLVYPSLSSLVSGSVEPEAVGEALGAVNGIKALTEGFGPLLFGTLMTWSETSALPGWPYLVAAVIVYVAYQYSEQLPDVENDEYVHELERKRNRRGFAPFAQSCANEREGRYFEADPGDEYEGLLGDDDDDDGQDDTIRMLSEVEESEDEAGADNKSRLPTTFAMLASQSKR